MKILKTIIAVAAFSAFALPTAQARDSYGLSISIGGHGYHGHHHAPAYVYRNYRSAPTIYYTAPSVIYYEPRHVYRSKPYRGYRHFGARDYGYKYRDHHYRHKKHAKKHRRGRHDGHHKRGRGHHYR